MTLQAKVDEFLDRFVFTTKGKLAESLLPLLQSVWDGALNEEAALTDATTELTRLRSIEAAAREMVPMARGALAWLDGGPMCAGLRQAIKKTEAALDPQRKGGGG